MENYARKIKLSNRTVYIIDDEDIVLQSYNAFVARIRHGRLILGPLYDYSPTTWRHVRKFITTYIHELNDIAYNQMYCMLHSQNGHATMREYIKNGIVPVLSNVGLIQGEC